MSIINDALKKAQRQRAQETTAHPASVGAHRGGGQHRAMGPGLILIVGLLGAIVVLLGTIAFWPSSPSAPAKVVAKPTTAPAPAPVVKPVVTAEPVLAKAAPEPTPILAPPQQDPKILIFISGLKIIGVRPAGNESRVFMNEHVYRLNDLIDPMLGVTLTGVTESSLTFKDAKGATYTRVF
ncbi:MAG TPA: hypothetical protein VKC60_03845 [Opitutaceae bacterium]|nr:hypothetical protein [Opitutaceae bacterium]